MDERNFIFMFYGFAAVYLILAGYVILLVFRERKINKQLETVKKMLEDREES